MARLIDADDYSDKLQEEISWYDPHNIKLVSTLRTIQQDLSNPVITPTVEPKKGKWYWLQYDANKEIGNWHCTLCNRISPSEYNYCPNCGADMR